MNPAVINVVSAEVVGDLQLKIRFDDGVEQIVDFNSFLNSSLHPDIRAWSSPGSFAQFHIEYGDLVWGDYDLCFPVIDLYLNRIEHSQALEAAV